MSHGVPDDVPGVSLIYEVRVLGPEAFEGRIQRADAHSASPNVRQVIVDELESLDRFIRENGDIDRGATRMQVVVYADGSHQVNFATHSEQDPPMLELVRFARRELASQDDLLDPSLGEIRRGRELD